MFMEKIVNRKAYPIDGNHVMFLEQDNMDKIYCTIYEKDIHMTQREIAKNTGYAEPIICRLMKSSLRKFFNTIRRNNRHLNPIEVTALVAEMLNVKTDVQYKRYFRALPNEIKKEVSRYARKNYN